ncbi:MAG: ribonuclease Z [Acidobacteria bacterium]|nr:ribonuclease Z [Acidobacteriota bacterium]
MHLTILGSGTLVPSLRRQPSGYLLSAGKHRILIDCGSGTMRRLLQVGTHVDDIDLILISHVHIDHVSELPLFLFAARYSPEPRQRPLRVLGSSDTLEFIAGLEKLHGDSIAAATYERRLERIDKGGEVRVGDVRLRAGAVVHALSSLAFRIEHAETSLVYTGDTEYCESMVELARDCDLLLCECSFPDGAAVPGHLTPSLAGRIAREAGARSLLLTHLYPPCDDVDVAAQVRSVYDGDLKVGEDLLEVSVEGV